MEMDMVTTINQRIKSVDDALQGYYSLWGIDKLYIPAKDLPVSLEQDFWEIILKFQRDGLVKEAYLGYGEGMTEGKPEVFKTMGKDGNIPTHTIEIGGKKTKVQLKPIYYIEIDPSRWNFRGNGKTKKDEVIQLFLNKDGDLYREPKSKFCYPLQKDQEPLRVVLYFVKNPNSGYKDSTRMIALSLEKDPQYLRTEIGKINRIAINRLGLGKEKLIQAKQKSGYRLNPKIKITTEKEILSR